MIKTTTPKKLFTLVILITTILFLTGCSSLAKIMDTWVGAPESRLVNSWGPPDQVYTSPDGERILTWKTIQSNKYKTWVCKKSFTIGEDGNIKTWRYENC